MLIWTDVIRAGLLFSIPAAAVAGTLRIEQLYVVSFVEACLGTLFDSAYHSYLPSLVGVERLLDGNAKLSLSSSVAEVGGPGLAGAIVQVASAPFAILVDAVSFVVSAVSLIAIRAREAARPRELRQALGREIGEGVRFVQRHALVFPIAASSVSEHFFGSFYAAVYSLYLLEELKLTPLLLGIVISAGGVGALIGASVAGRIVRRVGLGRSILVMMLASSAIGVLTPLASGPLFVATLMVFLPQLIGDGTNTIQWIAQDTVVQTAVPDRVLGRVNATLDVLSHGAAPFGALVAAAIAESLGVRTAIAVAWLGTLASVLFIVFSPLPRLRSLDDVKAVA
jgi:predicted MFS family arabinose efflux permease